MLHDLLKTQHISELQHCCHSRSFFKKNCVLFWLQVLSLAEEATVQEITHRHRELAKTWHPDHNPSEDAEAKFMRIHEAYEVLLQRHRPNRFK